MKKVKAEPESQEALDHSPSHLLHRVLQIALEIYTSEAGEGALTQRQYAVLRALDGSGSEPSGGLSQADLVRITGIDRSTMADMVARMLSRDLLKRERSASDGRANLVQLSEAGQAALNEMMPRVLSADEKILALLSPPKRQSFIKLLRKIIAARDDAPEPVGESGDPAIRAVKKKKGHKKDGRKTKKHGKATKSLPLPMPTVSEGAAVSEEATTETV